MVASLFPLQYLIATLALWLNRQQQEIIDYLKEENRLLKAQWERSYNLTTYSRSRPKLLPVFP